MEQLAGRVAVVTGAASGIGLGLARRFAKERMQVVIADVDAGALERASEELRAAGAAVLARVTDVSDPGQVQALADAAVERFGAVHVLCNNAGVGGFQRFGNTTLATWEWIMGVNLWGPIHGCRAFLPILRQQDEAHIVNTASMSAFTYAPDHHPYNVTKAGVVALTEGLYRELRRDAPHVGISVLCPGFVATRIADDERNAPDGHQSRSVTDPDLEKFRTAVRAGLDAGLSTQAVADQVVAAIRARTLHIFTHPEWLGVIDERAKDIVAGRPLAADFSGDAIGDGEPAQ